MVNKIKNGIVWVRTPKCATSTMAIHLQNFCEHKKIKFTSATEHGSMAPTRYVNLGHLWEGMVNWDVTIREKRFVMGSIRHPLNRFLSHYKHYVFRERRFQDYIKDISSFYLENYHNTHFEDKDYKTNTTTHKLKITPEFFKLFEERNKNDFELYNYIQYEYGYR